MITSGDITTCDHTVWISSGEIITSDHTGVKSPCDMTSVDHTGDITRGSHAVSHSESHAGTTQFTT